ncbi:phosphohydrolase [archaeon]|nr:phosphohydrolase [archaeon]MBT6821279.1 phosphohydrolase [archaeon]MBT7392504.1 phosphohydrolase [archaeon]
MNYMQIINKHYTFGTDLYNLYISHVKKVTEKALGVAKKNPQLNADLKFIEEAAMLHDIGIFMCNAPTIFCVGKEPYIQHGILGRHILEIEGFSKHSLVCERHTGTGITKKEIIKRNLPLPQRDMIPISIEEKIISFADLFFSKLHPEREKSIDEIKKDISKHGVEKIKVFENWIKLFNYDRL